MSLDDFRSWIMDYIAWLTSLPGLPGRVCSFISVPADLENCLVALPPSRLLRIPRDGGAGLRLGPSGVCSRAGTTAHEACAGPHQSGCSSESASLVWLLLGSPDWVAMSAGWHGSGNGQACKLTVFSKGLGKYSGVSDPAIVYVWMGACKQVLTCSQNARI